MQSTLVEFTSEAYLIESFLIDTQMYGWFSLLRTSVQMLLKTALAVASVPGGYLVLTSNAMWSLGVSLAVRPAEPVSTPPLLWESLRLRSAHFVGWQCR